MYAEFASVYDSLMLQDIDYDGITDFIENIFKHFNKSPELVCDLAAGTGNVSIPMAKKGYDVIAVDISEDMLNVAGDKAEKAGCDILFLHQDLRKLDLYGSCGAFLCMLDGFNYITSYNDLKNIFKRIRTCFIDNDGIFVFDISSPYKLKNILGSNTFVYDTEDMFYAWENEYKSGLCRMELNFFSKEKDGAYKRFREIQIQRAYSEKQIKKALIDGGFSTVEVFDGFSFEKSTDKSQRLVFAALA
ncbi:MAG: class I SAM-dependent methyltransferase [Clostridia bacterium]|nr:class I SAM-dependent methyltransferase [Clostridia bacterium]